jgi:hypothetical protein
MQAVDLGQIERLPNMTRAIALCADLGGFENDKDFCRVVGLDTTVWARIKDGERHYPHDGYEELFDACGNEAPLIWLAYRRGYVLTPRESELERRLRIEREENDRLSRENKLLRDLVQGRAV